LTDSFEVARQASSIAEIDWQHIELGARLGEGASGVIYQAKLWQADDVPKDVAIKLFKSTITSDGMPRSEMTASIAVGLHPNIVGVLGQVSDHPSGAMALVMPLIASDYVNLANPPSLESCTRDVYASATVLGLSQVCSVALDIARATEHLHACGILHGDLYAHNILYNAEGHGLLSDFGAASFLPIDDIDSAQSLQRIEVRAFGILLGELLAHCAESSAEYADSEQISRSTLTALQQRCTQAHASARPLFADVVCALNLHKEVASSAS
jgi:serine/threonine protein kinase